MLPQLLPLMLPGVFVVWVSPREPARRHLCVRHHQEANGGDPRPLLGGCPSATRPDGTWEHPEWGECT